MNVDYSTEMATISHENFLNDLWRSKIPKILGLSSASDAAILDGYVIKYLYEQLLTLVSSSSIDIDPLMGSGSPSDLKLPSQRAVRRALNTLEELIESTASGSPKGVYDTVDELETAYPTGATGIYVVKGSIKEVVTITVTGGATSSGNITLTLDSEDYVIAVLSTDDTEALVAGKINTFLSGVTGFNWDIDYTLGESVIILTNKEAKVILTDPSFVDTSSTGVDLTIITSIDGVDPDGGWYYWSTVSSSWVRGGLYQTSLSIIQSLTNSTTDVPSSKAVLDAVPLDTLFNVTVKIPLGAGYYTSSTARTAVPVHKRILGLVITYSISSGTWIIERFIGDSISDWDTSSLWEILYSKSFFDEFKTDTESSFMVSAQVLTNLNSRLQALENLFQISEFSEIQVNNLDVVEVLTVYGSLINSLTGIDLSQILTLGITPPITIPSGYGFYLNTSAKTLYISTGTLSLNDWKQITIT